LLKEEKRKITKASFIEGIRHRVASFDVLSQLTPTIIPKTFLWIVVGLFMYSCFAYTNGMEDIAVFTGGSWLVTGINAVLGTFSVNLEPGLAAMGVTAAIAIFWFVLGKLASDVANMLTAVYIFIVERKKIKKMKLWKKALYCVTWPVFDIFYRWSMYIALFAKVTWKPIPHTSKVTIEEIEN